MELWSAHEYSMDRIKPSYPLQFIFWTLLIINLILVYNLTIWFALDYEGLKVKPDVIWK